MFSNFVIFILFLVPNILGLKPTLLKLPGTTTLLQNSSASFTCIVHTGSLPYRFEWFKNEFPIQQESFSFSSRISLTNLENLSTLTLRSLELDDSGEYSCRVENSDGRDSTETILQVRGLFGIFVVVRQQCLLLFSQFSFFFRHFSPSRFFILREFIVNKMFQSLICVILTILPLIPALKPGLLPLPKNTILPQNSSTVFSCIVQSGAPPFRFEWFKNDARITSSNSRIQILNLDNLSTLTLRSMILDDSGKYSCVSHNSDGFDSVGTQLVVQGLFTLLVVMWRKSF